MPPIAGRILIGQPEVAVRNRLEEFFLRSGYEPLTANESEEAIDAARRGRVDLGVIDLGFPRLGGIETVRVLGRLARKVPCILTSGSPSKESQLAALDAGAVAFVEKPFTDEILLVAVERAFAARFL